MSYDVQGRRHGAAYSWFRNLSTNVKKIRMELFFVHGAVEGRLTRFKEDGRMRASEYWLKDIQEGEEIEYEYD